MAGPRQHSDTDRSNGASIPRCRARPASRAAHQRTATSSGHLCEPLHYRTRISGKIRRPARSTLLVPIMSGISDRFVGSSLIQLCGMGSEFLYWTGWRSNGYCKGMFLTFCNCYKIMFWKIFRFTLVVTGKKKE